MSSNDRHYQYVVLDVFTTRRMEGNPLAVFPHGDGIADRQMQQIAQELNLSETVFLSKPASGRAVARARIFTPRRELDFAGHPTIGSASVLGDRHPDLASFTIEENIGPVPIECETGADGTRMFWLTTPPVHFFETVSADTCARLLGLSLEDVAASPPQFASAGSALLFVHLASPEAVDRAELHREHLADAIGNANAGGTFVFASKGEGLDVYSRMFAPQLGIAEDPATGGATGPLAAYMLRYGLIPAGREARFTSEQGVKMGRRSLLHVSLSATPEPVIKVGGSTVRVAEATFTLDPEGGP